MHPFLFPVALLFSIIAHTFLLWPRSTGKLEAAERQDPGKLSVRISSHAASRARPAANQTGSELPSHAITQHNQTIQNRIEYPDLARRMGWEGQVEVEAMIENGQPQEIQVIGSSGFAVLDQTARQAVARHFFGALNGSIRLQFHFRLRDD